MFKNIRPFKSIILYKTNLNLKIQKGNETVYAL